MQTKTKINKTKVKPLTFDWDGIKGQKLYKNVDENKKINIFIINLKSQLTLCNGSC